jgi:hypothetical protein
MLTTTTRFHRLPQHAIGRHCDDWLTIAYKHHLDRNTWLCQCNSNFQFALLPSQTTCFPWSIPFGFVKTKHKVNDLPWPLYIGKKTDKLHWNQDFSVLSVWIQIPTDTNCVCKSCRDCCLFHVLTNRQNIDKGRSGIEQTKAVTQLVGKIVLATVHLLFHAVDVDCLHKLTKHTDTKKFIRNGYGWWWWTWLGRYRRLNLLLFLVKSTLEPFEYCVQFVFCYFNCIFDITFDHFELCADALFCVWQVDLWSMKRSELIWTIVVDCLLIVCLCTYSLCHAQQHRVYLQVHSDCKQIGRCLDSGYRWDRRWSCCNTDRIPRHDRHLCT